LRRSVRSGQDETLDSDGDRVKSNRVPEARQGPDGTPPAPARPGHSRRSAQIRRRRARGFRFAKNLFRRPLRRPRLAPRRPRLDPDSPGKFLRFLPPAVRPDHASAGEENVRAGQRRGPRPISRAARAVAGSRATGADPARPPGGTAARLPMQDHSTLLMRDRSARTVQDRMAPYAGYGDDARRRARTQCWNRYAPSAGTSAPPVQVPRRKLAPQFRRAATPEVTWITGAKAGSGARTPASSPRPAARRTPQDADRDPIETISAPESPPGPLRATGSAPRQPRLHPSQGAVQTQLLPFRNLGDPPRGDPAAGRAAWDPAEPRRGWQVLPFRNLRGPAAPAISPGERRSRPAKPGRGSASFAISQSCDPARHSAPPLTVRP
jgi:hypothetical protein